MTPRRYNCWCYCSAIKGAPPDDEQRALSQVCEMFLYEGVEGSKKDGPKFMKRLVAKQKARVKDP